ncbi:hypothetical protein EV421DRAFT_1745125 [Armillaria borealis]|uniref:Uncharacterized protein n=1 Tax=Armillaria borealis TaxID=47425 RepID=A0AA39MDR5_9AGAR|nr:hypothetical protein EV421DRAFT_1745125 [Armillaria borealis]
MTIFSGVFNQNGCKTGTSPLHTATDVHPDSVHGVKIVQVLVLVLLPAQGPNQERPGPQPCAVATKARIVLIARLRTSREVETPHGMAYNDEACGSCAQEWEE